MQNAHPAWSPVEARKDAFEAPSDRVWDVPDFGFQQHRAADVPPALDMAMGR
jgi:hypothetical protein